MKKILIMGASSGIGLALADAYAARGWTVGLAARRIDPLIALKEKYAGKVECEPIDITDPGAPEKMRALIARMGGMDIYLHVSGIGYDNPTLDLDRERKIVETNAVGFAVMLTAAYRYFLESGVKGQIAAVTSVGGTAGIADMSAYCATKRFDWIYMAAMDQKARRDGVKVSFTDIRPGWIRTPLLFQDQKYALEMRLEYALPRIMRAIDRKAGVKYIDWRWGAVCSLWRLIPRWLWVRLKLKF